MPLRRNGVSGNFSREVTFADSLKIAMGREYSKCAFFRGYSSKIALDSVATILITVSGDPV